MDDWGVGSYEATASELAPVSDVAETTGDWEPLREAAITALHEGGIGNGATSPYMLAVLDRC